DATPWEDSEFSTPGDQGEQNRMDLLTVLMHELGHVLGLDHDDDGVMGESLAAGVPDCPNRGRSTRPAIWDGPCRECPRRTGACGAGRWPRLAAGGSGAETPAA